MANASGTKWNGCCQRYEKYTSSSGGDSDGGGRASLPFEYAVWRMRKTRGAIFFSLRIASSIHSTLFLSAIL